MLEITSRQNKNYKTWLQCLESKGIQTHQWCILAGKKVIIDTLSGHLDKVIAVLVPKKLTDELALDPAITRLIKFRSSIETFSLTSEIFKTLDIFGTGEPLLIVASPEISEWTPGTQKSLTGCTLWLSFQDPRNVGAVLRSAAAFGVNQIVLGPGCAHPLHPASTRAASGGLLNHKFYRSKLSLGEMFADKSLDNSLITVALDMDGENLHSFKFPKSFILIPGAEGPGLDKKIIPTHRLNIQISSTVESLNAAVATSIVLYEWAKL